MEINPRPSSPAATGGYQAASSQSPGGPAVTGSGRAIQACDRCRMSNPNRAMSIEAKVAI